jgi:Cu-Zn family superoxide dismutase
MRVKKYVPMLAVSALILSASLAYSQHKDPAPAGAITKAIAVLHPTQGSKVSGTVVFTKVENGVKVHAHISGLTPGKHGFHVHEFGDCSDPAAKSAGGHFNPKKMDHGGPHAERRHVGDLGNIEADSEGNVDYEVVDDQITFSGDTSIIGRGLIVHEKADDLKTQPTGDAGGRVACGVIGVAKGS